MTHPSAAILALLCLLALATSASAECAWVLWSQAIGSSYTWVVEEAFESKAACDESQRDSTAWAKERGFQTVTEKKRSGLFYSCFPDTIDPRGPKGK